MARLARVVAAGYPHHVTQRGNRRMRRFLSGEDDEETVVRLRRHTRTGRALGSAAFVERMEGLLGLALRPKKPGPRPRKTGS